MENEERTLVPMIPAIDLANSFVQRFGGESIIDHLKLQKLCYFADGWWLALRSDTEGRLCAQKPQVWKLGPVFAPVYSAFSSYRGDPIREMRGASPFDEPHSVEQGNDSRISKLIDWVWAKYGKFDGVELSDMTHQPGTPWFKIAKAHGFEVPRFTEIPDDLNKAYFVGLAKEAGIL